MIVKLNNKTYKVKSKRDDSLLLLNRKGDMVDFRCNDISFRDLPIYLQEILRIERLTESKRIINNYDATPISSLFIWDTTINGYDYYSELVSLINRNGIYNAINTMSDRNRVEIDSIVLGEFPTYKIIIKNKGYDVTFREI